MDVTYLLTSILGRRPQSVGYVHSYRGVGHLPKNLKSTENPSRRILLDNLPKLVRGCAATPYVTALIVVVDVDNHDCKEFLNELKSIHDTIAPNSNVIFRIAIEEMEAWLLSDSPAILSAYPDANEPVLLGYVPDSICGTWETLANAIHPGGAAALKAEGWPAPGIAKCEWATKIGPHIDFDTNASPSFRKFLEALAPYGELEIAD